jgi:hypothetical protein
MGEMVCDVGGAINLLVAFSLPQPGSGRGLGWLGSKSRRRLAGSGLLSLVIIMLLRARYPWG